MLRVLHIGKFFPPFAGGIEHFMADLLAANAQLGTLHSAALVHSHPAYPNSRRGNQENYHGCPIYRAPCYGRLLYAPLSPLFPQWLERAIIEFKPNLLHIHMPNTSAFWCLRSRRAKALPWVVHWHSDVVASQLDQRLKLAYQLYRPFEQSLLRRSRTIIATSPPYLAASAALAAWQDRTQLIPLGITPKPPSLSTTAQTQAETLWGEAAMRLLCIGRLSYYKGHEVLLEALAQCPNVRLLIAGGGERATLLAKQIKHRGLTHRVQLLGYTEQALLDALLASCDVFCLPSLERTEAFGVVLLEAMRAAKPIIASAIEGSGTGWVVDSAQAGLTVPPSNSVALSEAIQKLLHAKQQRTEYGANGLKALQQRFAIIQIAEQIADLYGQISTGLIEKS